MSRIFISHSSKDEAEAIAIRDWLEAKGWGGNDDIFLDLDPKRGLAGGERWEEALRRNVRRCEAVIFVITPAWCKSKWCFSELQLAKNFNKPIFGIITKKVKLSDIPSEMTKEWQVVDLTGSGKKEHFEVKAVSDGQTHKISFNSTELVRLKTGLENAGIDPRYFEWPPKHESDRAPYQGLGAMQEEDAGIFFGREGQILSGLDQLRGLHEAPPPRMLVILGASGAGKSSYMRAGLLPRLRRDDRHFIVLDTLRPAQSALTGDTGLVPSLKKALATYGASISTNRIKEAIYEELKTDTSEDKPDQQTSPLNDLLHKLAKLASAHSTDENPTDKDDNVNTDIASSSKLPSIVIPIDQAEELYFNDDKNIDLEATQLRQLLATLAHSEKIKIILLLTIRSDSYQHMQFDTVLGGVEHRTLSLPPIPQGSYSEIILGPVRRLVDSDRKLVIEEKLVEQLLYDIAEGGAKDALPLLAFTLERLYSEYSEDNTLGLNDYEAMGGISGSIEAAVDQAFKVADASNKNTIPQDRDARLALLRRGLIPWLATVDPDTQETRRRVTPISSIPAESLPIMELLIEQRLLSTDTRPVEDNEGNPTGEMETTIEPAHEALLRQWGQLEEWLKEDKETLSALDGIKRAVTEWSANDQSKEFLAHSAGRLETAEQVANAERFHDYLSSHEREYLAACRTEDNNKRNRELEQQKKINKRTRLGLIAASVLTIIAGVIATWGWTEFNESNQLASSLSKTNENLDERAKELEKERDKSKKLTEKLKLEKEAAQASLDAARLNQVRFLEKSAETALNEKKIQFPETLSIKGMKFFNQLIKSVNQSQIF